MSKNAFENLANSFHKAEQGLQIDKIGNGGYSLDDSAKPVLGVKRPQTPAQHASVEKAGRTSAAKRKAGSGFKSAGKVFGF